jgi:hypothetical protein
MEISKLRFYWQNWADSATLTASSEAADDPVAMLQNRWKTVDWRSTGLTAEWLKANLLSAKPVQGFVFENMNLTAGSTVVLQAHASDSWGAPSYELAITITAAMVLAKRIVVKLPAAETYQWWRLLVTDASNPAGYLSAGRMYLGPVFEPAGWGHGGPWDKRRESGSEISESDGGQASAKKRKKYWVYELPISIESQADADSYAAIDDECGIDTPLWICRDSTDGVAQTIYARFREHLAFPSKIRGVLWETSLKFREEL